MIYQRSWWAWSLLVCWLVGCATAPIPPAAPLIFAAQGRLSLVVRPADAPSRQVTGRFMWAETAQHSQIDVLSPLGDTLARLRVQPDGSELTVRGTVETAMSPEALVEKYFGAPLPVLGLRYWLRGLDKSGMQRAPETFTEDGWQIEFVQMQAPSSRLPRMVRLQRQVTFEPIEIRLVIDEWQ